jgi:hypothetical protein
MVGGGWAVHPAGKVFLCQVVLHAFLFFLMSYIIDIMAIYVDFNVHYEKVDPPVA